VIVTSSLPFPFSDIWKHVLIEDAFRLLISSNPRKSHLSEVSCEWIELEVLSRTTKISRIQGERERETC
jgi:hypothetical protein